MGEKKTIQLSYADFKVTREIVAKPIPPALEVKVRAAMAKIEADLLRRMYGTPPLPTTYRADPWVRGGIYNVDCVT